MTGTEITEQVRPFCAYLAETNKGKTHADLSAALYELIAEVLARGKKGSLTLVVSVDTDDSDSRRLNITETVTSKLPQPVPRTSIFFADDGGNLCRNDPSQMQFPGIGLSEARDARRDGSA